MKATFHVSPEQLGPEGTALRDKEFLRHYRKHSLQKLITMST